MEGREGGREEVKKGLGEVRGMRRGEEREPGCCFLTYPFMAMLVYSIIIIAFPFPLTLDLPFF